MCDKEGVKAIRSRLGALRRVMDEGGRGAGAGAEAGALGRGGIAAVAEATGLSDNTIRAGVRELRAGAGPTGRVRRAGGGRKPLVEADPTLAGDRDALVEPTARGDPRSP